MIGWIILALVVLVIIFGVSLYNKLVRLRNRYKNAFAQIEVQLKRRHDLIPNLVETARAYMKHERDTLEAVIAARNEASAAAKEAEQKPGKPALMHKLMKAESGLSSMLGRLFALSESYPELKADSNMRQLSEEITTTENRIAFARQAYNDAVMVYNTEREEFPAVMFATSMGFGHAEMFEIQDEVERQAPRVSF